MKIYAVSNQKGGIGKSTTASTLAAGLILKGYRTLIVDLDAQGNATFDFHADNYDVSIYDVLTGKASAIDAIAHTERGDVIPSSPLLAGTDVTITGDGREYRLRNALAPLSGLYDYVVLDTPPALSILTINALTACDEVIIPVQADMYSALGLRQLEETIQVVRKNCNPKIKVAGILLTRYVARSILARDMAYTLRKMSDTLSTTVFPVPIRETVTVREAQVNRQSLFEYAPKAPVTADYQAFIDELLTRGAKEESNG